MLKSATLLESKFVPVLCPCLQEWNFAALTTVHADDPFMTGASEAQFIWEDLKSKLKFRNWDSLKHGAKFLGRRRKHSSAQFQFTSMNL